MTSKSQIFLMHTSTDEQEAEIIYQRLSEAGLKPWMGARDILPGEKRKNKILDTLEKSQFFLFILSSRCFQQGSLQKDLQDLLDRIQEKLENDRIKLIPLRLENCKIPEIIEDFQPVDLYKTDGWSRLIAAIQGIAGEIKDREQLQLGKQGSYTQIENLENNQGVVITGGSGEFNIDLRRSKTVNRDSNNTVINQIDPAQTASSNSQAKPKPEIASAIGKLVTFKIENGSFETGFNVTLQIAAENAQPFAEIHCKLPATPNIISNYEHWQSIYRDNYSRIGLQTRLQAPSAQKTNFSLSEFVKQCHASGDVLRNSLNTWLNSEQFRRCKEACLQELHSSEHIRVLIQTEDSNLRRLPWHLWNFFEAYHNAEIALSTLEFKRADKKASFTSRKKVRILAILGDRTGIDIQKDRAIIEKLPDAECVFLAESTRREVDDYLWDEKGWDILFFAGHSSSHSNAETGRIYLNQNESLTMGELRYALSKAIESGLQLAIFNSCDGLGIARELAGLHIPQIIAMREPVPDLVAQEFLKHFLTAFSNNKSLYLAVREARERLHSLEDKFPCATWLPAICQNPAEVPPTWESLRGG